MQWVEGSGLVKLISIRREKISTYGDKYPGPAAGSRRGLWRSSKVVIVGVSRCRRVVYLRRLKSWKVVIYVFTNHLGLVSAANTVHYCLLGWGMGGEEVGLTEPTVRVIRTPMVCGVVVVVAGGGEEEGWLVYYCSDFQLLLFLLLHKDTVRL